MPNYFGGAIVKTFAANLNLGSVRQPDEGTQSEFPTSVRGDLHRGSIPG